MCIPQKDREKKGILELFLNELALYLLVSQLFRFHCINCISNYKEGIFMLKEFQCSICTILDNFCSAIIEHTNQVIFLEDDDVAAVQNGCLTIHRIKRTLDESATREVTTIKMEIQQIMKGQLLI